MNSPTFRKFGFLIVSTGLLFLSSGASAAERYMVYASASGSDAADGRSVGTAVRTLDRAQAIARNVGAPVTIALSGRFLRSEPFRLDAADRGLEITAVPGQHPEIVATNGAKTGIAVNAANGVSISGLTLSGFAENGIFAQNSSYVHIAANVIRNTQSSSWSQAAIHLTGSVPDSTIVNNTIDTAGFAGIDVDTNASSNISNLHITGNTVTNTCLTVRDCGAIYVNDRSHKGSGIVIADNHIVNFGPDSSKGRGIYLDDWLSRTSVTKNSIAGPGTYAFQIHGGRDNVIDGNQIDMRQIGQAVLYQPATDGTWAAMVGNAFINNTFSPDARGGVISGWRSSLIPGASMPKIQGNHVCSGGKCTDTQ